MVLQRDELIEFRGLAADKSSFSIQFAGLEENITPGTDGRWSASFPALSEGGPYNVVVEGEEVISDIMVGDVFLCSGQSNMEYPIYRALNPDRELGAEHRDNIRFLMKSGLWRMRTL